MSEVKHPWVDKNHWSYHKPKTVLCIGCGKKCAESVWGSWCYECNVARMWRIQRFMDQLEKRLKNEEKK